MRFQIFRRFRFTGRLHRPRSTPFTIMATVPEELYLQEGRYHRQEPMRRFPETDQPVVHTHMIRTTDPKYLPATEKHAEEIKDMIRELGKGASPARPRHTRARPTGSRESDTEVKFLKLAAQWRADSRFCSSVLEMATTPAYQQIIGMGRSAVPSILRELLKQPEHWFWALKAITCEDPVPDEDKGDLQRMTAAWLVWGARGGYVF